MNNTEKTHPAATLTYEYALAPISENLYQRRAYEGRVKAFSQNGDKRLARDMQDLADVHWIKAMSLANFTAHLFGIYAAEVISDASERASAVYEKRRRR